MIKRKHRKKKTRVKNIAINQIPGQVTYVGNKTETSTSVEVINYNAQILSTENTNSIEDAFQYKESETISWININGLNNTQAIEKLGKHFNIHQLVLEDIANTQQRPKIEEHDDYLFVVLKMLYLDEHKEIVHEHISFVVGKNYLLTFQEADGDVFDGVRERFKNAAGKLRGGGTDYLMYALADAIVDNYFIVMENIADKIEDLEDILFSEIQNQDITQDIQDLKREILRIRRFVFPIREIINKLEKTEHFLIHQKTRNYLQDLLDHIVHVTESIEVYREMTWGLMDMYMTTISNKMNEVMKVLTIMASIFIPLTFMAGIYGMNFEYMPELHLKYGYYYLWGAMIMVFLGMIWYFRRKKWL